MWKYFTFSHKILSHKVCMCFYSFSSLSSFSAQTLYRCNWFGVNTKRKMFRELPLTVYTSEWRWSRKSGLLLWLFMAISNRKPKQYLSFGLRCLSLPAQNRWQSVRFWCVARRITYCRRCTANYIDTLYVQNNISLVTLNNSNANQRHFLNKNHTFCGELFF